jgi:hypothetical protein
MVLTRLRSQCRKVNVRQLCRWEWIFGWSARCKPDPPASTYKETRSRPGRLRNQNADAVANREQAQSVDIYAASPK